MEIFESKQASPLRELVLGGDGLIGSQLVQSLRSRGHFVTSLDLRSRCDLSHVDDAPFTQCDRVWFLAWDTGGAKYINAADQQHNNYQNNCRLSAQVFDALYRTERPFLFVTSQLAGQPTAYGLTKLMAEHWATQLGGKIARLWNVYGWEIPDVKSHVITDLVLSGLTQRRIRCLTSGHERRRFLYKSDCVDALMKLFDSNQQEADIAGGEWLSIEHIAHAVASQLNVPVELGEYPGAELIVEPHHFLPNWSPQVSLQEGIRRVIEDAKAYLETRGEQFAG